MSTDPFIAAARTRIDAEADAKRLVGKAMRDVWTDYGEYTLLPEVLAPRIVEWARAYLAAQEPTDTEVEAAARVIFMAGPSTDGTIAAWDGYPEHVKTRCLEKAREALSAARAALTAARTA